MSAQNRSTKASQDSLLIWVERIFNGVMALYLLAMLVVLPFYCTDGYTTIGTDKAMFFRKATCTLGGVVLAMAVIYGLCLQIKKKEKWNFTKTDVFVLVYMGALSLSFLASPYKEQCIWGAKGWFIGFLPQAFVLLTYLVLSKLWKPSKWGFWIIFPVSFIVFVLGYLNRFGIYPVPMKLASPSFISTIGNINWYCGYAVTVFFPGVFLYWRGAFAEKKWLQIFGSLYLFFGFATLVTQGSASGLVTVFVALIILMMWSGEDLGKLYRVWQIVLHFGISCLVTCIFRSLFPEAMEFDDWYISILTKGWFSIAVTVLSSLFVYVLWKERQQNTPKKAKPETTEKQSKNLGKTIYVIHRSAFFLVIASIGIFIILLVANTLSNGGLTLLSGSEIFRFQGTWGSNRGATWMAGLRIFENQDLFRKIYGVGPDAMSAYIKVCDDPWLQNLLTECFGTALLTNAHNEWLNVLVNVGILGCVGYVGMICCGIRELTGSKTDVSKTNLISAACGFGMLTYTINNMFSFQQTVNLVTMFVLFGIGKAFLSSKKS